MSEHQDYDRRELVNVYVCPCRRCPKCGYVNDDADVTHPFDAIHASPPCQQFTAYRRRDPSTVGADYPDLIAATRELLDAAGLPYVIENVPGAPLRNHVQLCGSNFGLHVRRHRWFETNWPLLVPPCAHGLQRGDYPQATNRANRRRTVEVGVWRIPLETQQAAMGVDWMTLEELSEAIPPAFNAVHRRTAARTLDGARGVTVSTDTQENPK